MFRLTTMVSKTCKEGETSFIKTRYDLSIKIRSFLIKYFHNFVIMSFKSAYPKFSNHPEIHGLNWQEKKTKGDSGLDFFHKEPAPGLLVTSSLLLLMNHEQNLDLLPKRYPTRIMIWLPKLRSHVVWLTGRAAHCPCPVSWESICYEVVSLVSWFLFILCETITI